MDEFFAKDWEGPPFALFGTAHVLGLVVVALGIAVLISVGRRTSEPKRWVLRYGLTSALVLIEVSWHLWNLFTGQWSVQTMLPLHLCSALVWLSAYMLIRRAYRVYEYAYLLGIAGALQALLTPDAGAYGFPHFRFFQVLASHGCIVAAALYMTLVEGFRPTPKSIVRVLVGANVYMVVVGVINALLGSNYLFIARKPETASLLDVLPPWPWYIGVIELLGLVFVALFYAPFAIKDLRARRLANAPS